MAIEIRTINSLSTKQLKKYIQFGTDLYKNNNCFVPPLVFDEIATLSPKKNPAFEICQAQSFMAYRDNKPVGRITGIINNVVNERTGEKTVRFGFADWIDDDEVADALFNAVAQWGKQHGMTHIVGPMGFSDMDHEGMLVEGFDQLGTMATIYNYPYYPKHMLRMGFEPEAEWKEFRIAVPDAVPEKFQRIADIVRRKYELKTIKFTSRKKLKDQYGQALFNLINQAYDQLYGYSPLTQRQIDHYIGMYLGMLRLDCVSVIVDKNEELVGLGISLPSLSQALQRSRGRLFPFGWYHLLKAINGRNNVVDLMLIAVKPEYMNKGVNSLLFADLISAFVKNGFKYAESNPELADNTAVQLQWQYFDYRQHRRRQAFKKEI